MSDEAAVELITIPGAWNLEFEHSAGVAASRFLVALRDRGVLLGSPCPVCRRVRVPARAFCEDCFVRTSDEWIEVGPRGTVESFTITYSAFPGYREPPHAIAYVRPDGASTAIGNYVEGVDLADADEAARALAVGTVMRAVFSSDRKARITDFHWELTAA